MFIVYLQKYLTMAAFELLLNTAFVSDVFKQIIPSKVNKTEVTCHHSLISWQMHAQPGTVFTISLFSWKLGHWLAAHVSLLKAENKHSLTLFIHVLFRVYSTNGSMCLIDWLANG